MKHRALGPRLVVEEGPLGSQRVPTRRLDQESRLGHERAKQVLLEQGIESVAASSPEEVMRWHAIAEAAVRELRGSGVYSEELIDALLAHLDSYRGQLPAAHGR